MSVRNGQENRNPETKSSSPSTCMVVKAGTIPASLSSFPGMELDQSGFNGLSQEIPPNGISQFVENPITFDDEKEIEAAATTTDRKEEVTPAVVPPIATSTLNPVSIPSTLIEHSVTTTASTSQTLPPLHIHVNDCSKEESQGAGSQDSEIFSNGSGNHKKEFQKPSIRIPQRPSTSSASTPIIMGPPSSTNTQVLLSPAGNLYNGFPRKSSGESSPGFNNRVQAKGNRTPHPLAAQKNPPSNRQPNTPLSGGQTSRPPSSLASPSPNSSVRKEYELSRRRALVDHVTKARGPDHAHLLHQAEQLSNTQMSILLRKNRMTLAAEGMPYSVQKVIDCGSEPDRTQQLFKEEVREANAKRSRHNNIDELTDVSDLEDDLDSDKGSQERRSPTNAPRWTSKRMRYSGLLSRTETLLDEKIALLGMLKNQSTVINSSSGVRFAGEEVIPRRRRQLNGMFYLYDKSNLRRANPSQFGCSRVMPIQSWTKREMHKDFFDESTNANSMSTGTPVVKPTLSPTDKWVATAQHYCLPHLTNGETREMIEFDYEEYKVGEVMQQVNQLSSMDPMDFVLSSDFHTMQDRQINYMHRIAMAPFNTIRKKHGKSIYYETDYRKASDPYAVTKRKSDKKKERKPVGEASDDEDQEEEVETKAVTKKRPRGRPVSSRRKSSKMTKDPGVYVDYLFDDTHDDICVKQLPNKVTYASIVVPLWYKIADNYWHDVPSSNSAADDLRISNAKQHHKLMHAERERIRLETDKRPRNRKDKTSAAATPAHNPFSEDPEMEGFPPFDMRQFEPGLINSRRLYASVEEPWEQRDFLNNHVSQPTQ